MEFLTFSVLDETFSSRRGRRADHAGKNRTSIGASYQKLWPLEISASKLLKICSKPRLNRGFNPNSAANSTARGLKDRFAPVGPVHLRPDHAFYAIKSDQR